MAKASKPSPKKPEPTKPVYRDAETGEFTTKKNVEKNPGKTTTEQRPTGKPPAKKK